MPDYMNFRRLAMAMRLDIISQWKNGFFLIYAALGLMYMVIINQLPAQWISVVVPTILFTDPTVLGLFFIGGIVMLEKQQGIIDSLSVTPLTVAEYMLSKLITLAFVALFAVYFIVLVSYRGSINHLFLFFGTILSSMLFTLVGFIVASKASNVNTFIFKTIPWMIALMLPCVLLFFDKFSKLALLFPSAACLSIVFGSFNGINIFLGVAVILYLSLIDYMLFQKVKSIFEKSVVYGG